MADVGEDEEYESDPEQAKLSLKMRRRRTASDDEEEDGDGDGDDRVRVRVTDSRVSDYESDGQGAAADYDDDEYDLVEEEEEEELREEVVDEVEGSVKKDVDETDAGGVFVSESVVDQFDENENGVGEGEGVQEGKKENEPFAVPTAGAFYMHDDRFRDSAGGRNRYFLCLYLCLFMCIGLIKLELGFKLWYS